MTELLFDVHLELDPIKLAYERDPTQTIAELSHREAVEVARERHARLRHPEPLEVVSHQAINALTGRDVMLVATRWIADK